MEDVAVPAIVHFLPERKHEHGGEQQRRDAEGRAQDVDRAHLSITPLIALLETCVLIEYLFSTAQMLHSDGQPTYQ